MAVRTRRSCLLKIFIIIKMLFSRENFHAKFWVWFPNVQQVAAARRRLGRSIASLVSSLPPLHLASLHCEPGLLYLKTSDGRLRRPSPVMVHLGSKNNLKGRLWTGSCAPPTPRPLFTLYGTRVTDVEALRSHQSRKPPAFISQPGLYVLASGQKMLRTARWCPKGGSYTGVQTDWVRNDKCTPEHPA